MKTAVFITVLLITCALAVLIAKNSKSASITKQPQSQPATNPQNTNPLSLEFMRPQNYPGSDITIEQTLADGVNYHQYVVSYKSDGLKIYALLAVPIGQKPDKGWPVVIFNHGYIPPEQYSPTQRYIAYVDAFAKNGYIVLKSNYRGNGNSEGQPEGAYYSAAYARDVLNAIASIKKFPDANSDKIGMWGHSMGGNIALRDLEVSKDIKAAVIWGGVVGSYNDLMNNWQRRVPFQPGPRELALRNRSRSDLAQKYGTPQSNPNFWNAIDPFYNISLVTTPIQLHHGEADEEVPLAFSQNLYNTLRSNGKTAEIYTYPGADHNISDPSFSLAIDRSVKFFDKYLK